MQIVVARGQCLIAQVIALLRVATLWGKVYDPLGLTPLLFTAWLQLVLVVSQKAEQNKKAATTLGSWSWFAKLQHGLFILEIEKVTYSQPIHLLQVFTIIRRFEKTTKCPGWFRQRRRLPELWRQWRQRKEKSRPAFSSHAMLGPTMSNPKRQLSSHRPGTSCFTKAGDR